MQNCVYTSLLPEENILKKNNKIKLLDKLDKNITK